MEYGDQDMMPVDLFTFSFEETCYEEENTQSDLNNSIFCIAGSGSF